MLFGNVVEMRCRYDCLVKKTKRNCEVDAPAQTNGIFLIHPSSGAYPVVK